MPANLPVSEWMPLKQSDSQETKTFLPSEFVANLLKIGSAELRPKNQINARKFHITCRHVSNPILNGRTPTFAEAHHLPQGGFTDAYRLDIFEEGSEQNNFIPIGHHDFYIRKFSDRPETVAEENLEISKRTYLDRADPIQDQRFNQALELAGNLWPGNALDVMGNLGELVKRNYQTSYIETIKSLIIRNHLPPNLDWQGYKFGKLLVAVKFEILKQLGINYLDLSKTSLSDMSRPLYDKLGYDPTKPEGSHMKISEVPSIIYKSWIDDFLRQE